MKKGPTVLAGGYASGWGGLICHGVSATSYVAEPRPRFDGEQGHLLHLL